MEITQYRIINIPNEIISIASTVSVPVSVKFATYGGNINRNMKWPK